MATKQGERRSAPASPAVELFRDVLRDWPTTFRAVVLLVVVGLAFVFVNPAGAVALSAAVSALGLAVRRRGVIEDRTGADPPASSRGVA